MISGRISGYKWQNESKLNFGDKKNEADKTEIIKQNFWEYLDQIKFRYRTHAIIRDHLYIT